MRKFMHCPVNCIVPDHILSRLIASDDDEIRDAAFNTLKITSELRGQRSIIGEMPSLFASSAGTKRRTIFNCNHGVTLPGSLVRSEGGAASGEASIDRAYDGLGATYDFYQQVFQRNSIDNNGMRLDATVHYDNKYNNAFWNGRQMVFGDGDGRIFIDFTKSLDVIGHELTHGITQAEAGLNYQDQPGALNESMSDVFGVLIKQYTLRQSAIQADWLIGKEILVPAPTRTALRSMKSPGDGYKNDPLLGDDPQPAHMDDYDRTTRDNGGVHINSGIPNHAFYLVATALKGNAWDSAGRIWYATLVDALKPDSQFIDTARLTEKTARDIYGSNSAEYDAVVNAWEQVGLGDGPGNQANGGRGTGSSRSPKSKSSHSTDPADGWDSLIDALADQVLERVMQKVEMKARVTPKTTRRKT